MTKEDKKFVEDTFNKVKEEAEARGFARAKKKCLEAIMDLECSDCLCLCHGELDMPCANQINSCPSCTVSKIQDDINSIEDN